MVNDNHCADDCGDKKEFFVGLENLPPTGTRPGTEMGALMERQLSKVEPVVIIIIMNHVQCHLYK